MYQEEGHSCSSSVEDSLLHKLVQGSSIKRDTNDKEDGVGDDGEDLREPKHHVLGQTKVGEDKHCPYKKKSIPIAFSGNTQWSQQIQICFSVQSKVDGKQ